MSRFTGADTEQLVALEGDLDALIARFQTALDRDNHFVLRMKSIWAGPFAAAFVLAWTTIDRIILFSAHEGLTALREQVVANRGEQEQTSQFLGAAGVVIGSAAVATNSTAFGGVAVAGRRTGAASTAGLGPTRASSESTTSPVAGISAKGSAGSTLGVSGSTAFEGPPSNAPGSRLADSATEGAIGGATAGVAAGAESPNAVPNGTATFDNVINDGARNQRIDGRVTVNGTTYDFRTGGHSRGSLPAGNYDITAHRNFRTEGGFSVADGNGDGDRFGYSYAMSDKWDSRVGDTRSLLRIHPDGGPAGTAGCVGIVGDEAVQRQFRADMNAELARNDGKFTLKVG